MYHTQYPHRRNRGAIRPFLVLIIFGLAAVLGFQVIQSYREESAKKQENKAALTVVSGRSEMKVWGDTEYVPAPTGSLLREGDALRTSTGSRAILALLNGSYVRVGENTSLALSELRTKNGQDMVTVFLEHGDVWLMKAKGADDLDVALKVEAEDYTVTSSSTVFAVSRRDNFQVDVVEGDVSVDVKEVAKSGKTNVIETVRVGVGQEFFATPAVLQQFRERKSPSAISALSENFRVSEWDAWNQAQDKVAAENAVSVKEAVAAEDTSLSATTASGPTEEAQTGPLPAPKVTEPAEGSRTISANSVVVRGEVSSRAQKVIVKSYVAGKEDAYVLQKYAPGSTTWSYIAAEQYANWVPGENRFVIVAVDAQGNESAATELILTYDKPAIEADLSAPKVTSFGGGNSLDTTESSVKVEGAIGKGIVKVYVNDFALTAYVPDSETWAYYAKTEYGNLKDGTNEYEVYGLDSAGNKTPITKFTIVKSAPPADNGASDWSPLQ